MALLARLSNIRLDGGVDTFIMRRNSSHAVPEEVGDGQTDTAILRPTAGKMVNITRSRSDVNSAHD
jgi:hypothetical protein